VTACSHNANAPEGASIWYPFPGCSQEMATHGRNGGSVRDAGMRRAGTNEVGEP
jgi:hypothetical protein